MQKSYRFLISALFLGAYLLSACTGAMPQQDDSPDSPGSSQSAEAVFTGTVESMGGGQWLISGQLVDVDGATSVDPNIQVGDVVKVEASVSADGAVVALKIESSGLNDTNANDNTANSNDDNANDDSTNTNDNTNSSNDNSNVNSNDDNSNTAPAGPEQEAFGVVEAVTDGSITIGGITYSIANFTEFKDLIAVGDQVKIHVIVNADGTLTIREIEKYTGTGIGDDGNSNDDNSNLNGNNNDDDNSNSNSNDDDDDDNSNSNSNDDDHDDDNSNDSNSNDD